MRNTVKWPHHGLSFVAVGSRIISDLVLDTSALISMAANGSLAGTVANWTTTTIHWVNLKKKRSRMPSLAILSRWAIACAVTQLNQFRADSWTDNELIHDLIPSSNWWPTRSGPFNYTKYRRAKCLPYFWQLGFSQLLFNCHRRMTPIKLVYLLTYTQASDMPPYEQ